MEEGQDWMPERNEEDTKFVRASTDDIPTKKHPQSVSELSIVQQWENLFKELVKGGLDTQTLCDKASNLSLTCHSFLLFTSMLICGPSRSLVKSF